MAAYKKQFVPAAVLEEKSLYPWMVLAASFIMRFLVFGQLYSIGVIYVSWIDEFQKSRAETAWVASIATGTTLLMGPIAAILYKYMSMRIVLIVSSFVSSCAIMACYFAKDLVQLCLLYGVLNGTASGIVNFGAVLSLKRYFYKKLPFATGFGSSGVGFGALALGLAVKYLLNTYSWRECMLILGAIQLNLVVCSMFVIETTPKNMKRFIGNYNDNISENDESVYKQVLENNNNNESKSETLTEVSFENKQKPTSIEKKSLLKLTLSILSNPTFLFLFINDFLSWLVQYVPYVHIPQHSKNLGLNSGAYLVSVMGLSSAVGKIVYGFVGSKLRSKILVIFTISQFLFATSVLLIQFCNDTASLLAFSISFGFLSGSYALMIVLPIYLLPKQNFSIVYGILLAGEGVGVYIGPPMIGWFSEIWSSYNTSLMVAGIILLCSALSLLPLFFFNKQQKIRSVKEKS